MKKIHISLAALALFASPAFAVSCADVIIANNVCKPCEDKWDGGFDAAKESFGHLTIKKIINGVADKTELSINKMYIPGGTSSKEKRTYVATKAYLAYVPDNYPAKDFVVFKDDPFKAATPFGRCFYTVTGTVSQGTVTCYRCYIPWDKNVKNHATLCKTLTEEITKE